MINKQPIPEQEPWEDFDYNFVVEEKATNQNGNIILREKFANEINLPLKVKKWINKEIAKAKREVAEDIVGIIGENIKYGANVDYEVRQDFARKIKDSINRKY